MKCPIDAADLVMTERQGIEIDYCPKCRGVWLDRGELDKIIERAGVGAPQPAPAPMPAQHQPTQYQPAERYPAERYPQHPQSGYDPRHKKKKSFLGDIFDFD